MSFIVFVLVVVTLLYAVSGKKYSRIPGDDLHKGMDDIAACMGCHGQGRQYELKKTHPPKYECLKCHKRKRALPAGK